MPLYQRALVIVWLDEFGSEATQCLVTQDQADASMTTEQPLFDAMQALTCTGLQVAFRQEIKRYTPAPVTGVYGSTLDVAMFVFNAADGTKRQINVYGPLESIFSDGINVDLTDVDVIEFVAQCIAKLSTPDGSPLVSLFEAKRGTIDRGESA